MGINQMKPTTNLPANQDEKFDIQEEI
jgi:hypothetical protein